MNRTWIKMCGMMRPQDALAAAGVGADAIGMVFHAPAKRDVSVERAREILRVLPPFVTPVGLFVDAPVDMIIDVCRAVGLRTVQLHGHESPDVVQRLNGLDVLKAVRADRATLAAELDQWRDAIRRLDLTNLKAILIESPGQTGGTGVANDWDTIAEFQASGAFAGLPPIVLAGGLTPQTVHDIVRRLHPFAVDVSSGIEQVIGEKSVEKMNLFASEARRADQQRTADENGTADGRG